jgi:uncharacterized protein (DUF1501 family)
LPYTRWLTRTVRSSFSGAHLNAENPVGTMQSIESALRALDKSVAEENKRVARAEKMLADYREQLGRPFEHELKLKELLARQAALNAALDLDKGERQVAAPAEANAEPGSDDETASVEMAVEAAGPPREGEAPQRHQYARPNAGGDDAGGGGVRKRPRPMIGPTP